MSVAVIAGLIALGSPTDARIRRLDARRVADLREITDAAKLYRNRHDRLAVSLEELALDPQVSVRSRDPTTAEPYEYRVHNPTTYEVCARFERASPDSSERESEWNDGPAWRHGAGRQCFQQEVKEARP